MILKVCAHCYENRFFHKLRIYIKITFPVLMYELIGTIDMYIYELIKSFQLPVKAFFLPHRDSLHAVHGIIE